MSTSKQTHHHPTIRKWAEERNGVPARIKNTGQAEDEGILRIHFPGHGSGSDFQEISWDDFFENFDDSGLDFLYQEQKENGEQSTFHKFIERS